MSGEVFIGALIALLIVFGFRRMWLTRSIPHYSPEEVFDKLKNSHDAILLDVRTHAERKRGHIHGSQHIPLHNIVRQSDELERYREKEIICYCQSGNRSVSAALRLRKLGFTAANMQGGIGEWNYRQLSRS